MSKFESALLVYKLILRYVKLVLNMVFSPMVVNLERKKGVYTQPVPN